MLFYFEFTLLLTDLLFQSEEFGMLLQISLRNCLKKLLSISLELKIKLQTRLYMVNCLHNVKKIFNGRSYRLGFSSVQNHFYGDVNYMAMFKTNCETKLFRNEMLL